MGKPEAQELSDSTVEEMIQSIEPGREIRTVTPAERGFCTVYRVEIGGTGNETTHE